MNDDDREVDLASLISYALEKQSKAIRVGMPGRIESFDSKSQTASVKPLLYEHDEAEDGSEENTALGVISGVPVQFPCAAGFILTFPVKKGDKCWLQFGDRSLENWFKRGADVDPVDLRRHALSDAVAILGVLSDPDKITEFDSSRLVLGKQGGKRIAFEDAVLHLGVDHEEAATAFIALADLCDDRFSKIQSTYDDHTHTLNLVQGLTDNAIVGKPSKITPGGLSGSSDKPSGSIGSLASVASAHVKSK